MSSTLTVPAGTTMSAYGATLDCSRGHFNALRFTDGGGVYGLTLIGAGHATWVDAGRAIQASGKNRAPAPPSYIAGPVVRDCTIDGWGGYGVYLEYCNRPIIERNVVRRVGYAGIAGMSCNDGVAAYNRISDVDSDGSADWYGVFWDRHNGATEVAEPRSYRCATDHNEVSGVVRGQALDSHAGVDMRFSGNSIRDCRMGIVYTGSKLGDDVKLAPRGGLIAGNVISLNGRGSGVAVNGAWDERHGRYHEVAQGVVIRGNIIDDAGAADKDVDGAINIYGTAGTVIAHNTIRRPYVNGINLVQDNTGVMVVGNTIIDPHARLVPASCLRVRGNGNSGVVTGNTFELSDAGLDARVADHAVYVTAGRTGTSLTLGANARRGMVPDRLAIVINDDAGVTVASPAPFAPKPPLPSRK